ncbi:MAG TPA: MBL fold metallo-hydrolase [Geobacteraceae bacterium]|nr:MBL fold metallo-hydrolase [Geobacteraceae bacterium]
MIFDSVVVGPLGVNCYIIGCESTREGAVIDPGGDAERIIAAFSGRGLKIVHVLNTHGHFDHIGANRAILEATGADLLIHEADVPFLTLADRAAAAFGVKGENSPPPDGFLQDGITIAVGELELKVIHTPGHTPGGCCFYGNGMVVTGDTLFAESIGRTDLPGGSLEALLGSIHGKLLGLPDDTVVYPGHGPSTTIGREKARNPYLRG